MPRETLRETMDRLLLLTQAGYPVIYIVSHEEARVLDNLAKIVRAVKNSHPNKNLLRWTQTSGLEHITPLEANGVDAKPPDWLNLAGLPDTIIVGKRGKVLADEALKAVAEFDVRADGVVGDSLTVFFDVHQYLLGGGVGAPQGELVRPLRNAAEALRRYYDKNRGEDGRPFKTIAIIAPSATQLSPELERDIIVVDFPLPEVSELQLALDQMIKRQELRFPELVPKDELEGICGEGATVEQYKQRLCEMVAGAGRGLTLEDYKLGLNMFAVRGQGLCQAHIEDMLHLKAKAISSRALQYTPHVEIDLGGLAAVKDWIRVRRHPILSNEVRERYGLPPPKGVMLCGVSGGGKSQLAKLFARDFNLALLRLDVGALFGQYVGISEENTRAALQLAEALAPVVLWVDEVDKAFQGISQGGDSGVSARVFGHFLTWLAEKRDDVFVVATANDFREMLNKFPEFGRKGRFDQIFWVTLPDREARQKIFEIYLKRHYDQGRLRFEREGIPGQEAGHGLTGQRNGDDELAHFCQELSQLQLSDRLTGAEIEYTVTEALYEAYRLDHDGQADKFTAGLVRSTVTSAKERALYHPNSDDAKNLEELERLAHGKNWPFV